ncbi:hypothetical protein B0H17DRAFT_964802, partial [Mycena rosella]
TYYDPDGGVGGCGNLLQNSDFIVILGPDDWDSGSHCGQPVNVHIQVTIQELCPGCLGADGIDLSEGTMSALHSNYINDEVIQVVWFFA